jgi:tetratricopeptide (TPR) repeat protein
VIAAQAQSGSQSSSQRGAVIGAPRAGLMPVHGPDLEKLEPDVREHLLSLQDSLLAATRDPAISSEKLAEAYGLMGQVYHAYSLTPQAEECYLNAHHIAPTDFRWDYLLANILHGEGRAEEAATYYQLARELRPNYQPASVNLGNLYLQQNRLEEARASFTEALKINANCAASRYGLGQVALSVRDYNQAVSYLEQALKEAPEANRIHYALAMAYRGAGNIEKARTHLAQQGPVGVRVSDPLIDGLQQLVRGERLHLIRARRAFDAGRFSEAAEAFRKAIAANPVSIPARVNLGASLAQTGDINGAIEQYQEALRIDSRNPTAHYNLGFLLAKQNQHEQAIAHFVSVLALNPDDTDARFWLAQELVKTRHPDEALAEFTRIVESDPGNEEALLEQVKLLLTKKQYSKAIERLEKGHTLFPQKGRTAITLAYLLACSPQYDLRDGARALELARLAYQATGLVNHGAIVAMALAELGRCSEAAEWQRQMITAAERDQRGDLVAKLKADLRRYENARPCRPRSEMLVPDDSIRE